MLEFWTSLLANQQFIPHGHCYLWKPDLVGLHILSDSLITLAYYSIPVTLVYFVRKRQDLPFNSIFLLFATFIITCGTTHLIEIWTLWYPTYWLSGCIKAITALISIYTSIKLIELIPKVLTLPSSAQLEAANKELEREISDRKRAEEALRHSEERWQLAVAGANEAIWDWNILTNQTFRSEHWFKMLGYESHELSNNEEGWSKRIHPDDYEQVMADLKAYLLQQTPEYSQEYRLQCKDGSYGWFRSRAKAVWDEQGNPVRLVGSLGDISDRKRAELALQEREAMLRRIGDNLPNGAIYQVIRELDGSDRFSYMSAGIERLTEVKAEDALKDSTLIYRQFIPEDVPILRAAIEESRQNLSVFDIQLRIQTPSEQIKWFHFRSTPRQLPDGSVVWDGLVVDITELKHTEEKLRRSETLLATAQKIAQMGSWEWHLDLQKQIWSIETFRIFGINPTESAPTQVDFLQMVHPEDRSRLQKQWVNAIAKKVPFTTEYRIIRADNSCRYLESRAEVAYDPQEQTIKLYGAILDITERKQAEQMLELQAVITRNIAEGVCLVKANNGVIVYVNPKFEQMFGYDSGELIGKEVSIVNNGNENSTPEEVYQTITATVLEHGEATYQVHNLKKDGTPFWCSATTSVFDHPEYGKVLVAVHQDITVQIQAQEQIKASLKEKEVLLQEIHHRVKNNLGIVSSLLQMQCRRIQHSQANEILRDSQNRIASIALVHEKLYRAEDLENIDFAQYIFDLTTHLFDSYNVSSSLIKLNIQVDGVTLDIETAIPCGLIINELVSNALKYAFPDNRAGEVQVKFEQQGDRYLTLIIQDNGVGLPPDFNTKKTKTLGTALVQGLVKQLSGNIEINCQQGTEFKINFTKSRI